MTRNNRSPSISWKDGAALIGALVCIEVFAHLHRVAVEVTDAATYTAFVFFPLTSMLREYWRRKIFWPLLAVLFGIHLSLVVLILVRDRTKGEWIHGIPMVIWAMVEAVLVAGILTRLVKGLSWLIDR